MIYNIPKKIEELIDNTSNISMCYYDAGSMAAGPSVTMPVRLIRRQRLQIFWFLAERDARVEELKNAPEADVYFVDGPFMVHLVGAFEIINDRENPNYCTLQYYVWNYYFIPYNPDENAQNLKLCRLEMPNFNLYNEYVNYQKKMQPCMQFESDALRSFYELNKTRILSFAEHSVYRYINDWRNSGRKTFPKVSDLTGEWYAGNVKMWIENNRIHISVFMRFLGKLPTGEISAPIDDYLGVDIRYIYESERDMFVPGQWQFCELYLEHPKCRPKGLPKDSILCPVCHGRGICLNENPKVTLTTKCKNCGGFRYLHANGEKIKLSTRLKFAWYQIWSELFFPVCLPFLSVFAAFGLLLAILEPGLLWSLGEVSTAEALLQGYFRWYRLLLYGSMAGALVILGAGVLSFVGISLSHGLSFGRARKKGICIAFTVLYFVFYSLFAGLMIASEKVPDSYRQAKEDIAQIESGELEQVTVWLSPKFHKTTLSGPYSGGQPKTLTRYGGISWETDSTWIRYYVPDCLDFALDEDALFDENKSIQWNIENAVQYHLTYTTNFYVVVSIEAVK